MEIEILEQQCGGTEFVPRPHRLHLGAQNAEGVDRLQFILPAAWAGCTLALYLRRSDGVQLAAIPLDADDRRKPDAGPGRRGTLPREGGQSHRLGARGYPGRQSPVEGVSAMTGIISAIIAGAVTLIGVLIANGKSQAVTDTKLEELTREVREHNNFARRVPILEEQMKVANHRIADLEKERN